MQIYQGFPKYLDALKLFISVGIVQVCLEDLKVELTDGLLFKMC